MAEQDPPELEIALDKVCWLIGKAREFDVKDGATAANDDGPDSDDVVGDVLEDRGDDPVADEIRGLIDAMSVDERADLVTIFWLGRDDDNYAEEWVSLREEAARLQDRSTADYLLGSPLLGDHLEAGLSKIGLTCEDFE